MCLSFFNAIISNVDSLESTLVTTTSVPTIIPFQCISFKPKSLPLASMGLLTFMPTTTSTINPIISTPFDGFSFASETLAALAYKCSNPFHDPSTIVYIPNDEPVEHVQPLQIIEECIVPSPTTSTPHTHVSSPQSPVPSYAIYDIPSNHYDPEDTIDNVDDMEAVSKPKDTGEHVRIL